MQNESYKVRVQDCKVKQADYFTKRKNYDPRSELRRLCVKLSWWYRNSKQHWQSFVK